MDVRAVRAAVQIASDTREDMSKAVKALFDALYEKNRITEHDIVSIHFTVTQDLQTANPATCLRERGHERVPMLCSLEPVYQGALERMLRVLVTFRCSEDAQHPEPVYLGAARALRPDLA